ncbi:MAG: endonuclease/exonuclease/phosphatase family protein [Bacteroidaceae bacterium]|nr:endonuclease/exonuclease/phosphatase family protein [Bacteroidaceae bacterium]
MGKKAVKQYFNGLAFAITIILFIFTFIGLYGGDATPVNHTLRALTTIALPFIIVCDVIFIIYWAIRRSWVALVPLLPILCSIKYLGTLYQMGSQPESVQANFTVASYNVHRFNNDATGIVAMDVMSTLQKEGADIICLQEFINSATGDQRTVTERVVDAYPYSAIVKDLAIFSRYPIKEQKHIEFEMGYNSGMWADVVVDGKHTLRVFNVHMETTGINPTLHQAKLNGEMPDSLGLSAAATNSKLQRDLFENYTMNSAIRAGQAITVHNELEQSTHPTLLCGDFNDVPYSFTYHTLLGDMKDGFREAGHGFAATYRGAKGLFRIDYIFHGKGMKSLDYFTRDQDYSDHKPVYSRIEFVEEQEAQ